MVGEKFHGLAFFAAADEGFALLADLVEGDGGAGDAPFEVDDGVAAVEGEDGAQVAGGEDACGGAQRRGVARVGEADRLDAAAADGGRVDGRAAGFAAEGFGVDLREFVELIEGLGGGSEAVGDDDAEVEARAVGDVEGFLHFIGGDEDVAAGDGAQHGVAFEEGLEAAVAEAAGGENLAERGGLLGFGDEAGIAHALQEVSAFARDGVRPDGEAERGDFGAEEAREGEFFEDDGARGFGEFGAEFIPGHRNAVDRGGREIGDGALVCADAAFSGLDASEGIGLHGGGAGGGEEDGGERETREHGAHGSVAGEAGQMGGERRFRAGRRRKAARMIACEPTAAWTFADADASGDLVPVLRRGVSGYCAVPVLRGLV